MPGRIPKLHFTSVSPFTAVLPPLRCAQPPAPFFMERTSSQRAGKGALLSALLYNERVHEIDDRLGKADRAPNMQHLSAWLAPVAKKPRSSNGGTGIVKPQGTGMTKEVRKQPNRKSAGRWSRVEEAVLASLVDVHGGDAWEQIAAAMSSGRSAKAVQQHWEVMQGLHASLKTRNPASPAPQRRPAPATPSEDSFGDGSLTDEFDDEDDEGIPADVGMSSARSARLAFLASEEAAANATANASATTPSAMPEWLGPEYVSLSEEPLDPVEVYATTLMDTEAID